MKGRISQLAMIFFMGLFVGMAMTGEVSKQIHVGFNQWSNLDHATSVQEEEMIFGHFIEFIVNHDINWDTREISVLVDQSIMNGTDAECEYFGKMMEYITRQGFTVYVKNKGFIPSAKNPINYEWAKVLAQGY